MDHDLARGLDVVRHRGEVVTLRVPHDFTDNVLELHLDGLGAREEAVLYELPLDKLLLLVVSFNIEVVLILPFRDVIR